MIVTAENTLPILKITNGELKELLPQATHIHLEKSTHDLWMTNIEKLIEVLSNFYQDQ